MLEKRKTPQSLAQEMSLRLTESRGRTKDEIAVDVLSLSRSEYLQYVRNLDYCISMER